MASDTDDTTSGETELADSIPHLIAIQPEKRGSARLVTGAALERLDDEAALELLQMHSFRR